jgi:hypothetical protein
MTGLGYSLRSSDLHTFDPSDYLPLGPQGQWTPVDQCVVTPAHWGTSA